MRLIALALVIAFIFAGCEKRITFNEAIIYQNGTSVYTTKYTNDRTSGCVYHDTGIICGSYSIQYKN